MTEIYCYDYNCKYNKKHTDPLTGGCFGKCTMPSIIIENGKCETKKVMIK